MIRHELANAMITWNAKELRPDIPVSIPGPDCLGMKLNTRSPWVFKMLATWGLILRKWNTGSSWHVDMRDSTCKAPRTPAPASECPRRDLAAPSFNCLLDSCR